MNKPTKIALLLGIILFGVIVLNNNIPCLFKSFMHIPCPTCGMTRAFRLLFQFKIMESLSYNILAIPLFIASLYVIGLLITDIFYNHDNFEKIFSKIINKYYILILGLLVISWIINLYRGI